jgi:hypothetical protein
MPKSDTLLSFIIIVYILIVAWSISDTILLGKGAIYKGIVDVSSIAIERSNSLTYEKVLYWVNSIKYNLFAIFVVLYADKNKHKKIFFLLIATVFVESFFSGSRSIIFYFSIGILFTGFYLNNNNAFFRKSLISIFIFAPIAIALLSIAILSFSQRIDLNNNERIIRALAYRFDLTDFAATLSQSTDLIDLKPQLLIDSLVYSTPRLLLTNKYDLNQNEESRIISTSNLPPSKDYTDTFFSTGVMIFGSLGFAIFFVCFTVFLFLFEKTLYHFLGSVTLILIPVSLDLYINIERNLNNLLADWRMLPVYILISILLSFLFHKSINIR